MKEVEHVHNDGVLTLYLWEGDAKSGPRGEMMVQVAPSYAIAYHAFCTSPTLERAALELEHGLWAYATGGLIGLVAYCGSQTGLWIDKTDPQVRS